MSPAEPTFEELIQKESFEIHQASLRSSPLVSDQQQQKSNQIPLVLSIIALVLSLLTSGAYLIFQKNEAMQWILGTSEMKDINAAPGQQIIDLSDNAQVLGVTTSGGSAVTLAKVLDYNFNLTLLGYIEGSTFYASTTTGPPLHVGSTIKVQNLNVDILDGYDWSGNIPFTGNPSFSGNVTYSTNTTISGNPTFSGNPSFTGSVSLGTVSVTGDLQMTDTGKQLKLSSTTSDPTNLGAGSMYYNSSSNRIKYYNGSSWVEINPTASLNPGFTLGSVAFQGSGGLAQDNSNFFWDDTNNRLGIGTNSPRSDSIINVLANTDAITRVDIENSNSGTGARTGFIARANTASGVFEAYSSTNNQSLGITPTLSALSLVRMRADNASSFLFDTTNSAPIIFSTNLNQRMMIDGSSGNVGIGTTNATHTLDVVGQQSAIKNAGTTVYPVLLSEGVTTNGAPHVLFHRARGTAFGSELPVQAGDIIGHIGWRGWDGTNYSQNLSRAYIHGLAEETFTTSGYGTSLRFYTTQIGRTTSGEQLTINDAGNIGIGSTTPVGLLNVRGARTGQAMVQLVETGNQAIFTASASGNSRFVIQNDGNVGIGTTVPTSCCKVDIVGAGQLLYRQAGSSVFPGFLARAVSDTVEGEGVLLFQRARGTAFGSETATLSGDDLGTISFRGHDGSDFLNFGSADIRSYASETFSSTGRGASLRFYTTRAGTTTLSERLQINSEGNIGIGTTAPVGLLNISGARPGQALVQLNETGDQAFLAASASGVTRIVINRNGNIGIGTTNPTEEIVVYDANTPLIGVVDTTFSVATIMESLDTLGAVGTTSNFPLALITNSLSRILIEGGGNVGIGTINPVGLLNVSGAVSGKALTIIDETGNQAILTASASGTTRFVIQNNGNVGIGTGVPNHQLEVRGTQPEISINAASGDPILEFAQNGTERIEFFYATAGSPAYLELYNYNGPGAQQRWYNSGDIYLNGNTGIGTTIPALQLHVQDSQAATASALIENTNTGTDADGLAVKLGFAGNGNTNNSFVTFLNSGGQILGRIHSDAAGGVTYKTSGIDFAEYFSKEEGMYFKEGDVVSLGKKGVTLNTIPYDSRVLGVVSAHPGFSGGAEGPDKVLVALVGQVPVKITSASQPIETGDPLASSNQPGRAMKSTRAGMILGHALEDWDPANAKDSIMLKITVTWFDPGIKLDEGGNIVMPQPDPTGSLSSSMVTTISKKINSAKDILSQSIFNQTIISPDTIDQTLAATASGDISADTVKKFGDVPLLNLPFEASSSGRHLTLDKPVTIVSDLKVLGQTTLGHTSVAGTLLLDGVLSFSSQGIFSLADSLYIQKNRLADVNILDGLFVATQEGNVTVNGNLTVVGNLTVSGILQTQGLSLDADRESTTAGINATAGKSSIPAFATSITLFNLNVDEESLIYLTPKSKTELPLYVENQTAGQFAVTIASPSAEPIFFNWWIVN